MTAPFTSSVVLKLATTSELTTLMRFIQRYFSFDHIDFDAKAIRLGLRKLLRSPSVGQAFLVMIGSKPVGYTILIDSFDLEFGGRVAFVTDFYLEPAYRRRGIGTEIMKQLEDLSRRNGVKTLELQAERRNRPALSFYRRMGFRRHDRVPLSKEVAH